MQVSKLSLLVVSLLLIIGVQPAVPRNIYHSGVFPFDGGERTAYDSALARARQGNFHLSVLPESNLESYVRFGDTDINERRSQSTNDGYGDYASQDGFGRRLAESDLPIPDTSVSSPCKLCHYRTSSGICVRSSWRQGCEE